jgi:tol-pal system protein YbgF
MMIPYGQCEKPSCPSVLIRSGVWILLGMLAITANGCMAQQADVVRIKRELDAKISQLDKSRHSLQQAVGDANKALEDANSIISKQRAEIKELLHARAELMDQMATLKETDLSQVRGALEKNQHQVGNLSRQFGQFETDLEALRAQVDHSKTSWEPLLTRLRDRVGAGEQLLTEQGGKLGEFRSSMVDYQQVLAGIRENLVKQERHIEELRGRIVQVGQHQDDGAKHVQSNFEEVRRSIQSIIGTLEKVSTTFGTRLDDHEQRLNRVAGSVNPQAKSRETASLSVGPSTLQGEAHSPALIPVSPMNARSSGAQPSTMSSSSRGVPSSAATADTAINTKTGGDPRVDYEGAFHLLRQSQFAEAARAFSIFLRKFPDSAYAANAQYWLGECYYGQRRFQEAIDEFERVFMLYPASNKVPASLLKIGYSHLELQGHATARSVFQQLIRTYPDSPEALKAQTRLQEVKASLR